MEILTHGLKTSPREKRALSKVCLRHCFTPLHRQVLGILRPVLGWLGVFLGVSEKKLRRREICIRRRMVLLGNGEGKLCTSPLTCCAAFGLCVTKYLECIYKSLCYSHTAQPSNGPCTVSRRSRIQVGANIPGLHVHTCTPDCLALLPASVPTLRCLHAPWYPAAPSLSKLQPPCTP